MEFDDRTMADILTGCSCYLEMHPDGARWLSLGDFTSITDELLMRLVAEVPDLQGVELGVRELSPRAARSLLGLGGIYLSLPGLQTLDEETACALRACCPDFQPILDLRLEEPLSEEVAYRLVGTEPLDGEPLSVSLPSISLPVARAFAQHGHELYLEMRENTLTQEVARVFADHAGHHLSLTCKAGIPEEAGLALSSNPRKKARITEQRNRAYIDDIEMLSMGHSEFDFSFGEPNRAH